MAGLFPGRVNTEKLPLPSCVWYAAYSRYLPDGLHAKVSRSAGKAVLQKQYGVDRKRKAGLLALLHTDV